MTKTVADKNVKIQLVETSQEYQLVWRGMAEGHTSDAVRLFLYQAKEQAAAQGAKIVMNLTLLEFMNSSFIGMVTNYVTSLSNDGAKVEIMFDTNIGWQELCRRAFSRIFASQENVTVTDVKDAWI
ncbi:MAG: hypothetical protein MUC50_13715 [Myxococcota bacterium]|jgi:hypothetical protein|nr:hypothetical protein [Myxococcota bacterium]